MLSIMNHLVNFFVGDKSPAQQPGNVRELDIQVGMVSGIKTVTNDDGGTDTTLDVLSFRDLSNIPDVLIDTPLYSQHIPVIGQQVVIARANNFKTRLLFTLGERPFDAIIEPGEVLSESTGGGFSYKNLAGDVEIGDKMLGNVIKLINNTGTRVIANALSLEVPGIGLMSITPLDGDMGTENKVEIVKKIGNVIASKITITNSNIVIDGAEVEIGSQNEEQGGVVVSRATDPDDVGVSVEGEFSYDIFTNRPIPRSSKVRSTF